MMTTNVDTQVQRRCVILCDNGSYDADDVEIQVWTPRSDLRRDALTASELHTVFCENTTLSAALRHLLHKDYLLLNTAL